MPARTAQPRAGPAPSPAALTAKVLIVDDDERNAFAAVQALETLGQELVVARSGEETFILSVLEQSRPGEARMVFEEGLSFDVLKGRLRVLAQEGVDLVTPQDLQVHAASVGARAGTVQVGFSLLDLVGKSIATKSDKVRVVAEAVDTVAGRIYQRAVNFFRRTDELDRVEARNIDRRADNLVHVHGDSAVTTAEHLVKIDAGQVHVG